MRWEGTRWTSGSSDWSRIWNGMPAEPTIGHQTVAELIVEPAVPVREVHVELRRRLPVE